MLRLMQNSKIKKKTISTLCEYESIIIKIIFLECERSTINTKKKILKIIYFVNIFKIF